MSRILQRALAGTSVMALDGEGVRLRLSTGTTVIDGPSGAAVACVGHGNGRTAHAHTRFSTSEPTKALAEPAAVDEPGLPQGVAVLPYRHRAPGEAVSAALT